MFTLTLNCSKFFFFGYKLISVICTPIWCAFITSIGMVRTIFNSLQNPESECYLYILGTRGDYNQAHLINFKINIIFKKDKCAYKNNPYFTAGKHRDLD